MKIGNSNFKELPNTAFTLVELSIVLVIIGLLVAGVMSGQSLVRSSKLQNVIKEIREYDTAIKGFKDKFKYYPGDFAQASSYWGTYAAGPPITGATNGNGDWRINNEGTELLTEGIGAWRQLSLGGFIPGTYTAADAGAIDHLAGKNVPGTAIHNNGFYTLIYYDTTKIFNTSGTALQLGTAEVATAVWGKILTAKDSKILDTKIDDGRPATGNMYAAVANDGAGGTCTSSSYVNFVGDPTTVTYVLTNNDINCRLFWWLDNNK